MSLGKDRQRIGVKGSGTLQIRELVSGSSSTAWSNLGYVKSNTLDDVPENLTLKDEAGNIITNPLTGRVAKWTAVLMQSDIDIINLIRNADGKIYEFYYAVTLPNGYVQEYNGFANITSKLNLNFASSTERTVTLEMVLVLAEAAYTRNPTDYNNSTPTLYVVIENAVAKGAPVDQVGTVYTAVV